MASDEDHRKVYKLMGKTVATAMTFEDMPKKALLKSVKPQKKALKQKAAYSMSDDINDLPTHEIARRLYNRHKLGVWQSLAILPWIVVAAIHLYSWSK